MEKTLFNITDEQLRIFEQLEENGGELTPEIEEALAINEQNFMIKAEGYIEAIAKYKAAADIAAERIATFTRIKKTANNIEARLKERIMWAMQIMGRDRVEVGARKLSIRNTQAVSITDASQIPNEFIKVETSVDKMKIKEALKGGTEVTGAELVSNQSITIR